MMSSAATIQAAAATMRASSASWNSSVEARSTIHSAVSVAATPTSRSSTSKLSASQIDRDEQQPGADQHREVPEARRLTHSECRKRAAIRSSGRFASTPRSSQVTANTTADQPELQRQSAQQRRRARNRAPSSASPRRAPSHKSFAKPPLFALPRSGRGGSGQGRNTDG